MAEPAPTYVDAGDALWAAERAVDQALRSQGMIAATDRLSSDFMRTMHALAVDAAAAGGELSQARCVALNNVFWLAKTCPDPWKQRDALVADPALSKQALANAITCAEALCISGPQDQRSPDRNLVCQAAAVMLEVVLTVDAGDQVKNARAAEINAALRQAVLALPVGAVLKSQEPPPTAATTEIRPPAAPQGVGSVGDASQTVLPSIACPARLHDGETCVAVTTATLFQESNVVRSIKYGGLSGRARISRGLSYRAGSYDVERTRAPKIERIAEGTLCVTDQRLIFLSDAKNLDLPFSKLLSCATQPGTVEVTRSNSGRLLFEYADPAAVAAFEQVTNTSPDRRLAIEAEPPPSRSYRVGRSIGHAFKLAGLIGLFLIVVLVRVLI